MRIESIPNRGPANLADELQSMVDGAKTINIGSAFITSNGVSFLKEILRTNKKTKIHILTGFFDCFISPKTIQSLEHLKHTSKSRLEIRYQKTVISIGSIIEFTVRTLS